MNERTSFLLWVAALSLASLAWTAALALVLWGAFEPAQRDAAIALLQPFVALMVLVALLLPVLFGALLRWPALAYPRAALRMRDDVLVIGNANPQHRIGLRGAPEMRALGAAINVLADAHGALEQQIETRIGEAQARLAQEKTWLAALMSELTQGVLVCNREGRILLYNARASALLEATDGGGAAAANALVGLNRSVFGLLDKGPIVHALEQVTRRIGQQVERPVAHFVTTRGRSDGPAQAGQVLRAQLVPVQGPQSALTGYVLILDDITRATVADSRRDLLLRQLTEGSRSSLANLRAAAETLHDHPELAPPLRQRFVAVVHEEAQRMSVQLDDALARGADPLHSPWPREDILASDLVFTLQRNFEAGLGLASRFEGSELHLWLHLDSHALVQALTRLTGLLRAALGLNEIVFELSEKGRFARLALCWAGKALDPQVLHAWESQVFAPGADAHGASLGEVLTRHGAEIWSQTDPAAARHRLCVQLPTTQQEQRSTPPPLGGRPVYYDFDLFHQAGQSAALDETPLAELTYTVFDTETTGLAPSEGDEIISIGALRIVNGRLLKHECFDRLVKPRRAVGRESQQIHGITPQMLAGQPALEQVLPMFARFAEDTVLIAHNAAFDMRFLALAHKRTQLRFDHPVLDTLLLASLVQPGHRDQEHRLEQIATRLGLDVVGRHTALGDATVTGEIFLRLLPLLAERGVRTLKQAREASRQSVYATLDY